MKRSTGRPRRAEVGRSVLARLSRAAGATCGIVYFLVEDEGVYERVAASDSVGPAVRGGKLKQSDPVPAVIARSERAIARGGDKGATEPLVSWMAGTGMQICLPLRSHSRLIGFCLLSGKQRGGRHTPAEVRALEKAACQIIPQVENVLLGEALQKARLLLRRVNRSASIQAISGEFAHEIRNPLTSIKTFISMVSELKSDPDFINRFSRVALEDVERIERLLDEMLQFAKSNQIRMSLENIDELVSSSVYFIRVESERRGIRLRVERGENLPAVLLDRQQIKQVLLNLFLNALDAMSQGGELSIRTGRLARDGEEWIGIDVTDTGCGISPENIPLIFDPFFTTKRRRAGTREGTGLGLAIVQQIVEDHRGRVEVRSRLGSGTTFTVLLPLSPLECDLPPAEAVASQ
jgi:signal transduction histidine kinase